MGGLCASKFKPGPPNDEAQVMTSKIRDIIKSLALLSLYFQTLFFSLMMMISSFILTDFFLGFLQQKKH